MRLPELSIPWVLLAPFLLLAGEAHPQSELKQYRLGGSVFEDRTNLYHQVQTSLSPEPDWILTVLADQSGTRYADTDYSSDSHRFDIHLDHALSDWVQIGAKLAAQRSTYVRNTRVEQDIQDFNLFAILNVAPGVVMQNSFGANWFRNRDEDSQSTSIQSNSGLENELVLKTRGDLGTASWDGSLGLTNQFLAVSPSSELKVTGTYSRPGPGMDVDIDFTGSRLRDFPISEALRGFEERLSANRRLSTTVGRWFLTHSLMTETRLSVYRDRKEYLDQPQKDRREEDDDLTGTVLYQPGDSLHFSVELSRGYRREIDALTEDTYLDRRIERRFVEGNVGWRPLDWFRLDCTGSRSLHQTDHRGSPNQDDGDDLDDIVKTSFRLRPFAPFLIVGGFSADLRKERHLNAKWAAFSLDRSSYVLNTGLEYKPRDEVKLFSSAAVVATLSEYLYTANESTVLLEQRLSSGVDWESDWLVVELFAQLQFRTIGDLLRSSSGTIGIVPTREEQISTVDTYIERPLGERSEIDMDWRWRESAVKGHDPVTRHEFGVSLSALIGDRYHLSFRAEDIYRPVDVSRHQVTLRAQLTMDL